MVIHGATDMDIHPPVFGGAQRCLGLYRGLARRNTVRVLCMVPNRSRGADEEVVDGVEIVRRRAWFTAVAWRLERVGLSPLFLAERGHRARARATLRALGGPPDVLMADLPLSGVLPPSGARLRVHHAHNVEFDHFLSAGPALLARGHWASRLRAMEARAIGDADLVVAASDEDAERLRALYRLPGERVVVAANGYDERAIRPPSPSERAGARAALGVREDETVCAFVGSDVPHNRTGLALLVERIMPSLAGDRFRLLVIGRVTRALGGRREPWLIAHGEVPAISPLLAAADIGVNPIVGGSGSNIKLPTYLAAGLAVVTTPHGLRGFAPLAPHVSVADAGGFADALRTCPAGWARDPSAGPPPAVGAYAWGAIGERLGGVFAARLAPAATVAPPRAAHGGAA